MIIILYLQMLFLITGLVFIWIASTKRTEAHPYHSNCKSVPVWKQKNWYTPSGYRYHLSGTIIISIGFLLGSCYYIFN